MSAVTERFFGGGLCPSFSWDGGPDLWVTGV